MVTMIYAFLILWAVIAIGTTITAYYINHSFNAIIRQIDRSKY